MSDIRPRLRSDCAPRPCPWCGQAAGMRLESLDEDAGAMIFCVECRKRVVYYSHGSSGWHWACAASGMISPVHKVEHLRALNTCRPCPWISCRHHLYLEVHPTTGAMKINFKGTEPEDLQESCAADIATRGGIPLEEVGIMIRLTRERIRQVAVSGIRKIQAMDFVVEASDLGPNLKPR